MFDAEYWDESEFNFFNILEDNDKLLYIYDLMVGEFVHEYNRGDESINDIFEIEFDEEPMDNIRQDVTLTFTDDGKIKFTGSELSILLKVASDMVMNGLILSNQNVEFTKFEPWDVILTFDLIGETSPISLN
jgi:hypothetical protein